MQFSIKCDVFLRLAEITKIFKPTTSDEVRNLLSCVRIEHKTGHAFAIATNQEIAAIQYLGTTTEPDGAAHVITHQAILDQCAVELQYDSLLSVTTIPEFATGLAQTMLGWEFKGNACIFPSETPMDGWREWALDKPVKSSKGVMYWEVDHIAVLAASCPSGKIYFPQHVDVDKPITLRDLYDDNWVGLFIPKPDVTQKQVRQEATLPAWWAL